MKYLSILMAVWYCLSIIGFDVHSCTVTGESFLASTYLGTSCKEIHPEHSCQDHGSCCQHHQLSCQTPSCVQTSSCVHVSCSHASCGHTPSCCQTLSCSHASCSCSHTASCRHDGAAVGESKCCTSDIHMLTTVSLTSMDGQRHYGEWNSSHCPCLLHLMSEVVPYHYGSSEHTFLLPDSGLRAPDRQAILNIWRI